jgi:hypothetical protein
MNSVGTIGNGCVAHRAAIGVRTAVRDLAAERGQGQTRLDPLQRFLWGALVTSFPFTAASLWPNRMKTFGEPAVVFTGLLAALTLLAAMLPRGTRFIPRGRSAILLSLFLAIIGASFFVNYPINPYMWPGHSPWLKSAKQLTQWFTDGVVVYLTLRFVRTWSDFRFAMKCFFIGFLCTVGAAVLNLAAIRWPEGHAASLFALLHNGAWSGQTTRLSLLAFEPSLAGDYMLSIVPLLVCGSYYWKSRGWTIMWSIVAVVLFCGTFSLGSFGSLFAACIIVAVVYGRRGSKGLLVGSLLLATVLLVAVVTSSKGAQFLGDRVTSILQNGLDPSEISDLSTRQRLADAEAAFGIFLDHPITGVGIGKAEFFMYGAYPVWALSQTDVSSQTFNNMTPDASSYSPDGAVSFNLFLQLFAETGLLGGTAFVVLLLSMLADCYVSLNTAQEKWKRKVFAGILFALVAQIIHYNATMTWSGMRYWFFIWGLAICAPNLLKQKDPKMPERLATVKPAIRIPLTARRPVTSAR